MKIAEVRLKLNNWSIEQIYDYIVTEDAQVGQRIRVPFSNYSKEVEGIIVSLKDSTEYDGIIKEVIKPVESVPVVSEDQLKLIEFLSKENVKLFYDILKYFTTAKKTKRKGNNIALSLKPIEYYRLTGQGKVSGPRQKEIINALSMEDLTIEDLKKKIEKFSRSSLNGLIKKGLIEKYLVYPKEELPEKKFSETDNKLKLFIKSNNYQDFEECLLEGLNKNGGQAVIVFPTNFQALNFYNYLKDSGKVNPSIYNTISLSEKDKYDFYNSVKDGSRNVIVGTSAALFLPFQDLKLIIFTQVDNKIYHATPEIHYNALQAAEKLSEIKNASIYFFDYMESVLSDYKIRSGEWIKKFQIPETIKIETIDINYLNKREIYSLLSDELKRIIEQTLKDNKKVILLFNRKGYYNYHYCNNCHHVYKCPECSSNLKSLKSGKVAYCQFCGYEGEFPESCPECGSKEIKSAHIGINKIIQELRVAFPKAKIGSYFEENRDYLSDKDIIIGTSALLNIPKLDDVAVTAAVQIDLDTDYFDYKAPEEAVRLYTGFFRNYKNARHIVQTASMDMDLLKAIAGIEKDLINKESEYRNLIKLPPYYDLTVLTFTAENSKEVNKDISIFNSLIEKENKDSYLTFSKPSIVRSKGKQKGKSIRKYHIKSDKKVEINKILRKVLKKKEAENIKSTISVVMNPASFL